LAPVGISARPPACAVIASAGVQEPVAAFDVAAALDRRAQIRGDEPSVGVLECDFVEVCVGDHG